MAGDAAGFLARGHCFSLFFRSNIVLTFNMFFDRFWFRFGTRFGAIWEANIDQNRTKFGPRRLLNRYFLKNVNFHEKL